MKITNRLDNRRDFYEQIVFMLRFLKGSRLTYTGALLAVDRNVALAATVPMVIRITLDSILGDVPLVLPCIPDDLVERFGALSKSGRICGTCYVILVSLTLLQGAMQLGRTKLSCPDRRELVKRMRDRVFLHVQRQPYDYHVKSPTGDIIQRCTSDLKQPRTSSPTVRRSDLHRDSSHRPCWSSLFSMNVPFTIISVLLIPVILILNGPLIPFDDGPSSWRLMNRKGSCRQPCRKPDKCPGGQGLRGPAIRDR